MSSEPLESLARIGTLHAVPVDPLRVSRLLSAASQRFADARRAENSPETRFDCAYTRVRLIADAALLARGYRVPGNRPGHHQVSLQCLVHSLGADAQLVRVLDALRKQRNLCDYEGDVVSEQMVAECIGYAENLLAMACARGLLSSE
jgi:hypothetical protein